MKKKQPSHNDWKCNVINRKNGYLISKLAVCGMNAREVTRFELQICSNNTFIVGAFDLDKYKNRKQQYLQQSNTKMTQL